MESAPRERLSSFLEIWDNRHCKVSTFEPGGRSVQAGLKANQNKRSPPLTDNLIYKGIGLSVLETLITVPLHSTLAVNKLGCKIIHLHVLVLLYEYAD